MRRQEWINRIARDCVHFKGDRPCRPHLLGDAVCRCQAYSPRSGKVLIIQLSSATRVIHSNTLIHRLKGETPGVRISYLTTWPELLSAGVDEPLGLDAGSVQQLQMEPFDQAYNLDLDKRACAIMNLVNSPVKKGFYLRQGDPLPLDEEASSVYLETILPGNFSSEQPEKIKSLFQLCGLEYRRETPRLKTPESSFPWPQWQKPVIGLNTSNNSDSHEKTVWKKQHWARLIDILDQQGVVPLLLGSLDDDSLNRSIAQHCPAEYVGPAPISQSRRCEDYQLSLRDYMALIGKCDVVVGVSGMTMELAAAIGRKTVSLQTSEKNCRKSGGLQKHPPHTGKASYVKPVGLPGDRGNLDDILPDQVFEAVMEQLANNNASPAQKDEIAPSSDFEIAAIRSQVSSSRRGPH